jgi:uncharacterized membrane protein
VNAERLLNLPPRTLRVLLALSLAVNLLVGAAMAGRATGEAVQSRRTVEAMVSTLPAEKREAVRQALFAVLPVMRQHNQAVRALRAELDAVLAQPQLDEAALDRQFIKLQQQTTATQARMQQAFRQAAVNLTSDERRALLVAIQQRPRRDRDGRGFP